MKTYPDFTWEWIIQSCEQFCIQLQDSQTVDSLSDRTKDYIATAQALIAITPKLREHPQLEKLVPMKSLLSLRWFPSSTREVDLNFDADKSDYKVSVFAKIGFEIESVIEQKRVPLDQVADEIYAYITKLRDD